MSMFGDVHGFSSVLRGVADAREGWARAAAGVNTNSVCKLAVSANLAKIPQLTGLATAMSPVTATLKAHQALFSQAVPAFLSSSLTDSWSPRLAAMQDMVAMTCVAHRSAREEIAYLMQRLAELRTLPQTRGLARTMGRLWQRAIDAARELSRRAVTKFTGERTDINPRFLGPSLWKVPDEHLKLKSTLVLGFAQDHYVIRELLIRAPGLGGSPRPTLERSLGEALCPMNNRPTVPTTLIG